jgi:putative inorganic carbon (HCO3(-)) transporter
MDKKKLESVFSSIILISAYLTLFSPYIIAPLFFASITSKYLYIIALTEIIFFSWLILFVLNKKWPFKINSFTIILAGFLVISILASIFSINPILSFWGKFDRGTNTILIIHLFLFLIATTSFFRKKHWQEFFLLSIIIGSSIALILIGSYLGVFDSYNLKSGVTLGNSSFLATYLLFIFFFSLYLFFEEDFPSGKLLIFEKGEIKFLTGLGLILCGTALPLSGGRAATFSALCGLILFLLFYFSFKSKTKLRILAKLLLVFTLLFIFWFIVCLHVPESFFQKELTKFTTKARFLVWQGALRAIKERPVLGFGPETFELVYVKYFNSTLFLPEGGGEVRFDKAHNIIFETLISCGFLGLILYLAILIYIFYFLFNGILKQTISFWIGSSFFCLILAYFLQNLTVFDTPVSDLLFFIILGFLASQHRQKTIFFPQLDFLKFPLVFLVLIVFFFSFNYFLIQPAKTAYFLAKIPTENLDPSQREEMFKKAINSSLFGRFQAREYYAFQVKEKFEAGEASREELDFAINEFEKNLKEIPQDYYSRILLAKTYNYLGTKEKDKLIRSQEILEEAIEISPKNLYAYWYLIETKILQKEYEEALSLAQRAIKIEPKIFHSHLLHLKVLKKLGDEELEKKKEEEIKILFPERSTVLKK